MKVYPDHTFENAIRDKGLSCLCMWEQSAPKKSNWAWLVGYLVGDTVVIVQTFKEGRGWQAFLPVESAMVQGTIDEIVKRTKWLETA